MKEFIVTHLVQLFISIGGVGMVITMVVKNTPKIVGMFIKRALSKQKYKEMLIKYRPEIEAFFDAVDAEVKRDLDDAANADNADNAEKIPPQA